MSYIFSTSLVGNTSVPCFPQMEERLESLAPIGGCRLLSIFTLSTTTKFLYNLVFLFLGTVHNEARTYFVEVP